MKKLFLILGYSCVSIVNLALWMIYSSCSMRVMAIRSRSRRPSWEMERPLMFGDISMKHSLFYHQHPIVLEPPLTPCYPAR